MEATESLVRAARQGSSEAFAQLTEPHRRAIELHCYRMLGSSEDAEDLTQETFLRAWQRLDSYEGRASFRAWLYGIATHACLDALDRKRRRARTARELLWMQPAPLSLHVALEHNPEARVIAQESVRMAFMIALQQLPPRQRAVLILRDVLGWRAEQAASSLHMSVPAINSALHRARMGIRSEKRSDLPAQEVQPDLLEAYVAAWEASDIKALMALLHAEVQLAMPPEPVWIGGRDAVAAFLGAQAFAAAGPGLWRLRPLMTLNGPALVTFRRDEANRFRPFGVQMLNWAGPLIQSITVFLHPGLPERLGLEIEVS